MSVEMHSSGVQFHSLSNSERVRHLYLDLEHMEVILLFTVNCPRCSQALSHQVTTSLSLYCWAAALFSLEHCRRKDGTNSSSPKALLVVPLCNLNQENSHQGGAPHVQSIFPLLNCFLLTRIYSFALIPHSKKEENKKLPTSCASKTISGALFVPLGVPGKKILYKH